MKWDYSEIANKALIFLKAISHILLLWTSAFCIGFIKLKYKYILNLEIAKRETLLLTSILFVYFQQTAFIILN